MTLDELADTVADILGDAPEYVATDPRINHLSLSANQVERLLDIIAERGRLLGLRGPDACQTCGAGPLDLHASNCPVVAGQWAIDGGQVKVLVVGDPFDGLKVYGPITPNDPVLEAFTDNECRDDTWWYVPVSPIPTNN